MTPDVWHFDTQTIGRRVFVFPELSSTNDHAAQLTDPPDGLVILAEHQTQGRGQPGRDWLSRPRSSILMSVIVNSPVRRPVLLCAWAGVSVCHALAEWNLKPMLKWPNDVLVDRKKICGILVEQKQATIVGIGLNVSQSQEELLGLGLEGATSLTLCSPAAPDRRLVFESLIRQLDRTYAMLCRGDHESLAEEWRCYLGLMNRTVKVELARSSEIGILHRLDWDTLEIDAPAGRLAFQPEQVRHLTIEA